MTVTLQQLLAASALIVTCERLASSGILSEAQEADMRRLVVRCCNAFEIPTVAERPIADAPQVFELVR